MSAKIMGLVYDLDLPANEQSVLIALADHADHQGGNVFPSNGMVAWKLGTSTDTVSRLKKKLEARGILVLESAVSGSVKRYRIDLAKGVQKKPYKKAGQEVLQLTPPQSVAPLPPTESCGTSPSKAMRQGGPHSLAALTVKETSTNHQKKEGGISQAEKLLIEWSDRFEAEHGGKYVRGKRDLQNFASLLAAGIDEETILRVSEAAWKKPKLWNSRRAVSVAGLCDKFNEIRAENKEATTKPNPTEGF